MRVTVTMIRKEAVQRHGHHGRVPRPGGPSHADADVYERRTQANVGIHLIYIPLVFVAAGRVWPREAGMGGVLRLLRHNKEPMGPISR